MREEAVKSAEHSKNRGERSHENIKLEEMIEKNVEKNNSRLNRDYKKAEQDKEDKRIADEKKREEEQAAEMERLEREAEEARIKAKEEKKVPNLNVNTGFYDKVKNCEGMKNKAYKTIGKKAVEDGDEGLIKNMGKLEESEDK